jgi:hypothetical protein
MMPSLLPLASVCPSGLKSTASTAKTVSSGAPTRPCWGGRSLATGPITHPQGGIVWRIGGEIQRSWAHTQVRPHVTAVCKTVGSAYVGSNPTPATTCENGPLAGNSRLGGPFFSVPPCVTLSRCRSSCCAVHGRMADGVRAARTVGAHRRRFHGRPRTGHASEMFGGIGGVSRPEIKDPVACAS